MVNQFYEAEILKEYVIRGNAAVLKCSIPSFVADFVRVESWIDELGIVLTENDDFGVCVCFEQMCFSDYSIFLIIMSIFFVIIYEIYLMVLLLFLVHSH